MEVRTCVPSLNPLPLQGNGGEQGSDGPDRTNNVEQVAVAYMPAGQISIEVSRLLGPVDNKAVVKTAGPIQYLIWYLIDSTAFSILCLVSEGW